MIISVDIFCSSFAIFLEFYWKFDNKFLRFTHLYHNKTPVGHQSCLVFDLLCKEDLSVGLSFASFDTEIFIAQ